MLSHDDLKSLAEAKLADAILLLKNKRYSGAYYLAGYTIEMGLKAVIAKQFMAGVIPDRKFVNNIHTHDLSDLVRLAGLTMSLSKAEASPAFAANWLITTQWSETTRYEMIDMYRANELLSALTAEPDGVVQWLQSHW